MCVLVLTFLLVFTHASARSPHCCAADGVLAWRRPCLARVIDRCQKGHAHCKRAGVYQFGVFTGQSMRGVSLALAQSNVSYGAMYGFDSFDGLPDIEGGSAFAACSGGVCGWRRGAYNATDVAKTCGCLSQGFTEGVSLPKRLAKYIGDARIVWVPGWFDASLTDALARRLAPALYVDIDTDLYSSAATALNWLFSHGLVQPGSVIGYDDWATGGKKGEQRAHREAELSYRASFRRVDGSNPRQPCFEVISIGESRRETTRPLAPGGQSHRTSS